MAPIHIHTPAASVLPACAPEALAALGPLLCLHAAADPHLLTGWSRAVRLIAAIRLDSDGPWEALRFFDAAGACCWCLHLLPDSDFHAWERLLQCLPVEADRAASLCASAWPWRRAPQPRWRACALRLHVLPEGRGSARLAATDVRLSKLGHSCAQRITRQAGASAGMEASASWPGVPVSGAH